MRGIAVKSAPASGQASTFAFPSLAPLAGGPPERSFLIAAVRAAMTGVPFAGKTDSVNWALVQEEAAHHKLRPQLWRSLDAIEVDSIPAAARHALRNGYQENLAQNLVLTSELRRILNLLGERGISVIPFKGPTLAMLAYGDLSWREAGDLDLLVAREDLVRAADALAGAGYRPQRNPALLRDSVFLDFEREFHFQSGRNGALIDLQWRLSSDLLPFVLEASYFSKNQTITWPGGSPIATFRLEDLLVYLCVHGSRHRWERLGWIADVAGVINRNPELDWDLVLARALGRERVLFHSLLLAHELMGARLPVGIESLARADAHSAALALDIGRALSQPLKQPTQKRDLHRYFLNLQPRATGKFQHLLRVLFTPTVIDWEFLPLPARWRFLYPAVRLARLIAERLPKKQHGE